MLDKETGIPCFECGRRSGIDCPGRKDEATRCKECFDAFMEKVRREQVEHLAKYIGYLRREKDTETEQAVWSAIGADADVDRKDVCRLLGGNP